MLDAEALWEICLLERKVMNINLGSDNIEDNIDNKVVNNIKYSIIYLPPGPEIFSSP